MIFHQNKSGRGVVQHSVDKDFQVGETKRGCVNVVNKIEGSGDDGLQILHIRLYD